MELYRMIILPSDEPVAFVGCYVLNWGENIQPSVGFIPIDEDFLVEFGNLCRQYPNEPISNLIAMVIDENSRKE